MSDYPDYLPGPEAKRRPGTKAIEPHEPHNHRCRKCGLIWHHDPAVLMPTPYASKVECELANQAFKRSHNCPTCGTSQHYIDQSGTPAQCVYSGVGEPAILKEQPKYEDDFQAQLKRSLLAELYR